MIERVFIVHQEMYTIGGCCPDLPDSAYLKESDAEKRIHELYDDAVKYCVENNICIGESYIICNECMVQSKNPKQYYFKAYIAGSVPLIKDYENDWNELQVKNQKSDN